jgi:hypothetical protein
VTLNARRSGALTGMKWNVAAANARSFHRQQCVVVTQLRKGERTKFDGAAAEGHGGE